MRPDSSELLRFDGLVAVVSGAGGGLGRSYALALSERGAQVVINDIAEADPVDSCSAERVAAEIRDSGGEAIADRNSVLDAEAIVATAVAAYGGIDILVNNAGVNSTVPFELGTNEDDERVIGVNVLGPLRLARAAWQHLKKSRSPAIVNIGSTGSMGASNVTYGTTKAAIVGLSRNLAMLGRQSDPHIRVNLIMPSAFTSMSKDTSDLELRAMMEKLFDPGLVAPFVTWLCHGSCPISGEMFSVGGGRAARVILGVVRGMVVDRPSPESFIEASGSLLTTDQLFLPETGFDEFFHGAQELGLTIPGREGGQA
jgi:NAD(P)-dependent dehydrogenase (short-subunit alcohol dehydrogenase family)